MVQRAWGVDVNDIPKPKLKEALGSWLGFRKGDDASALYIGCVACAARDTGPTTSTSSNAARGFGNFSVAGSGVQKYNLKRHHALGWHKDSCLMYLGLPTDYSPFDRAPNSDAFKKVWDHIAAGLSPAAGVAGVGEGKKVNQLVFCVAESIREIDRKWLSDSCLMSLRRDEREGRLCVRFAATKFDTLETRCGTLGVATAFGTGATAITGATDMLMKTFCTDGAGPRNIGKAEPKYNGDLDKHLRAIHSQLIVDSASDELLSGRQMASALMIVE